MLQKKQYTTPTTRFASVNDIFDLNKPDTLWFKKKKKLLNKSRKIFYRMNSLAPTFLFKLNCAGVINSYAYNKKPYQLLLNVKTLYNNTLILPGIEFLVPGKKVFDLTKNLLFNKIHYLGSQITLEELPHHLFMCCIANNYNNKWSFAKSSGTFGTKLKAKKTVKLMLIRLPSETTYLFLKGTRCFIGKNNNFFNNKFIEGKWGFSIHKHKTIAVRGVAMNPVDHPNGGRTKAKQPEKSPWGWIAKKKK